MHVPSELLKVVSWEVVLPLPCITRRKRRPLQGGGWSLAGKVGRWEGLPRQRPRAQTLQCSHKPLSQAWDGNTDKNTQHPRAGRVSFYTETCKQSRSYSILFPQDSSERNRPGCHSRGSFFFFFLLFHGNLSQQHYHLRHFRER